MPHPKLVTILTLFVACATAHAGITISTREGDDNASTVGGFRITLNDPEALVAFSDPDKAPLPASLALESVTLTARQFRPGTNDSKEPLKLKIYEDAERTSLVAESAEALGWAPGQEGAVKSGETGVYHFAKPKLQTDKPYFFVFETGPGKAAPAGMAGVRIARKMPIKSWRVLSSTQGLTLFGTSVAVSFTLKGDAPATPRKENAPAPAPKEPAKPKPPAGPPPAYRIHLAGLSEANWRALKPALLALEGVESAHAKVTGEVILTPVKGRQLSRQSVEKALGGSPGVTLKEFTPLDTAP